MGRWAEGMKVRGGGVRDWGLGVGGGETSFRGKEYGRTLVRLKRGRRIESPLKV